MRFRGYALLYVLGVMLVSVSIMAGFYYRSLIRSSYAGRVSRNSKLLSALTDSHSMIRSAIFDHVPLDTNMELESGVLLRIRGYRWGLFDVSYSLAFDEIDSLSQAIIWGSRPKPYSLALTKNAVFEYAPNHQIGSGVYLHNTRSRIFYQEDAPEVIKLELNKLGQLKEHPPAGLDVALSDDDILVMDIMEFGNKIFRSFERLPVLVQSRRAIRIQGDIHGPFLIRSDTSISVSASTSLKGVILQAPCVKLEDRTVFIGQIYASDSVVIGSSALLSYPSAIVLDGRKAIAPRILLGEKVRMEGEIRALVSTQSQNDPCILVGDSSVIYGGVYTNGEIQLLGDIFGQVYARSRTVLLERRAAGPCTFPAGNFH